MVHLVKCLHLISTCISMTLNVMFTLQANMKSEFFVKIHQRSHTEKKRVFLGDSALDCFSKFVYADELKNMFIHYT